MQYANRDFRGAKMDSSTRRITNTWLIREGGSTSRGDFLLHSDGSVSDSKGDEDVIETIDGKNRLVTRSLQNWHTHLGMVLNRGMGEGLPLMEWLETAIFPVEKRLTGKLVEIGTRAAAAHGTACSRASAYALIALPLARELPSAAVSAH